MNFNLGIQNTKDIKQPYLACLFYGELGSGKTTIASTFPSPLFLLPPGEGSELTLKGLDYPFIRLGKKPDGSPTAYRAHVSNVLDELDRRHARMRELLAKGDEAGANEAFPWMTIVLESLSHWNDALVEDITEGGKEQMDQRRWGFVRSHFQHLHAMLRRWEAHAVYLSISGYKEDEKGKIVIGQPGISGKTATALPASCDIVGYCEQLPPLKQGEPKIHRTHFAKRGHFPARTRFREMPTSIDNCTFEKIAAAIGYND